MTALVHLRDVLSVLAGVVAFVLVGIGVTAALDPHIAFSILVGLPVGFTAAIATVLLANTGLAYRRERRDGSPTARTTRRFRTAVVGAAAVVVVGLLGTGSFALDASSTGLVLLLCGTPAAFVAASAVTYFAFGTSDGPRSPTEALAFGATALLVTLVGTVALMGSIGLYLAAMVAVALALGATAIAYRFVVQRRRPRTTA